MSCPTAGGTINISEENKGNNLKLESVKEAREKKREKERKERKEERREEGAWKKK